MKTSFAPTLPSILWEIVLFKLFLFKCFSVFRLRQMREMQAVVTDVCAVHPSVTQLNSVVRAACVRSFSTASGKLLRPL